MAGASFKIAQLQAFSNCLSRNNAIRAGHHLVIGPGDFIMQPTLHCSIPFLQGAQTSAHNFACRAISACFYEAIYE